MGQLECSLTIKQSDNRIIKDILKLLVPEVKDYFDSILNNIRDPLKNLVIDAIKKAPEYDSLLNGNLKAEFGLPDSDSRVNAIIQTLDAINVKSKKIIIKGGEQLSGGFELTMIPINFSNILKLPEATFTTEKGDDLNWLQWLLLFGNETIIKDYEVKLGPNPKSRTGMAVMRGVISGKWSVPSRFAGTVNNNWITRAIDSVDNEIENLISTNIRRV